MRLELGVSSRTADV